MADKKYIDWILEGKTAWNKRRELHDFRPHFSSVGLSLGGQDPVNLRHDYKTG